MNQNLAPTFEDLNSPAIDVAQSVGELAVMNYDDTINEGSATAKDITFDSFL